MNPYVSFTDPLNLETGNSELSPKIVNLFELTERYTAARKEPQVASNLYFHINAGIRKKFANERGSISLTASDIFNTRVYQSTIKGNNFSVNRRFKFQSQRITLGLRHLIFR